MTFNCNGCGGRFNHKWLVSVYLYGDVQEQREDEELYSQAQAQHLRTLCLGCHHVIKSMLLNSDLSDHWHREDSIPAEFLDQHA